MLRFVVLWGESQDVLEAAATLYWETKRLICQNKSFCVNTLEEYKAYMEQFIQEYPGTCPMTVSKDEKTQLLMEKFSLQERIGEIDSRLNEIQVKGVTHEPDAG